METRTLDLSDGVLHRGAWIPGTRYRLFLRRFVLIPLTVSMVDRQYLEWMSDPDVVRFLDSRYKCHSLDSIREFVGTFDNAAKFIWRIVTRTEAIPVGNCTLFVDQVNSLAEPGIAVGNKSYWGRNVTFEVYSALFDFAFETIGVEKIFSKTRAPNIAAIWNCRKLGMRQEGFLSNHVRLGDGRTALIWYGLDKRDWMDRSRSNTT